MRRRVSTLRQRATLTLRRLSRADKRRTRDADDADLKLFALSFTAFFVCIYTFVM
jgi:hypothetical protein